MFSQNFYKKGVTTPKIIFIVLRHRKIRLILKTVHCPVNWLHDHKPIHKRRSAKYQIENSSKLHL